MAWWRRAPSGPMDRLSRLGGRGGALGRPACSGPRPRALDSLAGGARERGGPRSVADDSPSTMMERTMTNSPLSRIISISDIEWKERQPGVQGKSLWEDPATHRRALMTRLEPGAELARHRHVGDELVFVIEGAIADDFGMVTAGNMGYRPNGCVHTVSSKNGATVLAILTGGVEPDAERGHAPPSEIFTLSELPWVEARAGVRQKRVWEDTAAERRAILARFEPGATLAPHRHVGDELIFMIEGANADESGPVATGNMNYRPNGCVHTVTTKNGATVLAVVWGRTEPVGG